LDRSKWQFGAEDSPFDSIQKGRVNTEIPDDGLNPSTFVLRKFYPSFFLIHITFRRVPVCPGRWRIGILFSLQSILHGRFESL
jgi:hypothetical protein